MQISLLWAPVCFGGAQGALALCSVRVGFARVTPLWAYGCASMVNPRVCSHWLGRLSRLVDLLVKHGLLDYRGVQFFMWLVDYRF